MKKLSRTLALFIFCAAALTGYAAADTAMMPILVTVGLIYLLVAAVIVIAVVLVVKLIISISGKKGK